MTDDERFNQWKERFRLASYSELDEEWGRLGDCSDVLLEQRQIDWIREAQVRHPFDKYWWDWAPDRFSKADLTCDPGRLSTWTRNAHDQGPTNLHLLGSVGTGKTWSAYGVCQWLADHRWACLPYDKVLDYRFPNGIIAGGPVYEILDGLKRRRFPFEALVRPNLLLLDDMAPEPRTEWAVATLFAVIDARYRAGDRGHIITSNLSAKDLSEAIGKRTYDRLCDGATRIPFSGRSRRQPADQLRIVGDQT